MAEREFKLTFLGDSRRAQAAIGDLDRKLGGLGGKVSGLTGLTMGPQGLAVAFGGALVGGIAASIKSTAAFADSVEEMSQRTGLSTTRLQELQHAANLTGADINGLEVGVRKMQSVLTDAANGSKAAEKAFGQLGLEAKDLIGLGTDKQLEKIMLAMANIEDPTTRASIAVDIFGRSGTDLLPMLAGGEKGLKDMAAEAHNLGVVMDEDAIRSAAEFQDKLDKLQGKLGGLQRALSGPMIDFLLDFAEKVEVIAEMLERAAGAAGRLVEQVGKIPGASELGNKLDLPNAVQTGVVEGVINAIVPGGGIINATSKANDIFKKITGRAFGGPVTAGELYWVGEHGPEPFIPWTSGTILPTSTTAHPERMPRGPVWADTVVDVSGVEDRRGQRNPLELDWYPHGAPDADPEVNFWANPALASVWDSFDSGGVVPGSGPRMAVVHGGETILPTHKGGGNTYIVNMPPGSVYLGDQATVERWITGALHMAQQRGALGLT